MIQKVNFPRLSAASLAKFGDTVKLENQGKGRELDKIL